MAERIQQNGIGSLTSYAGQSQQPVTKHLGSVSRLTHPSEPLNSASSIADKRLSVPGPSSSKKPEGESVSCNLSRLNARNPF